MLNYVWIALLFLGIGAAVTTDLKNDSIDKYRNNESLPVTIEFKILPELNSGKTFNAGLKISSSDFNNLIIIFLSIL